MKTTLALCLAALLMSPVLPAFADTKTIISEATYIMGDGETPSFAESMAIQKAKQTALEEAGTYVQSYTKVLNQQLTADEIQTIAGGVLQVEVLDKQRELVSDGLRVSVKIKATVTTDKVEELARRVKGKNIAGDYAKLQAEYAKLSHELENWKQRAEKTPQGREREAALDQIREGEKAFARVQQRETEFFQRLVSGKQLVAQASSDKEIVDELLKTIVTSGYVVTVGEARAVKVSEKKDMLALNVPLTIRVSEALYKAVSQAASALGGIMRSDVKVWLPYGPQNQSESKIPRIGATPDLSYQTVTLVRLGKYRETANYFQDRVMKLALLVTFLNSTNKPLQCLLGPRNRYSSKDMALDGSWEDDWFPLRRIFPVDEVSKFAESKLIDNSDRIDNGYYDMRRACEEAEALKKPCRSLRGNITRLSGKEGRDIPEQHGYVAIVRDEATFVAQFKLSAKIMKNLTGVRVRVLSNTAQDEQYQSVPRCTVAQ